MNKKLLTLFLAVLMLFGLCITFSGCFESEPTMEEKWEINTISCTSEKQSTLGYYTTVKGTLKNKLNKSYSYVQIQYSMYDEDGNNLGTAFDNMNNLGAGETWSFSATSMGWTDVQVYRVKLSEISAY